MQEPFVKQTGALAIFEWSNVPNTRTREPFDFPAIIVIRFPTGVSIRQSIIMIFFVQRLHYECCWMNNPQLVLHISCKFYWTIWFHKCWHLLYDWTYYSYRWKHQFFMIVLYCFYIGPTLSLQTSPNTLLAVPSITITVKYSVTATIATGVHKICKIIFGNIIL